MRFQILTLEDIRENPDITGAEEDLEGGYTDDFDEYVVDSLTNRIVFSDRCEPEDASLSRHYGGLVDLLNEVANE